MARTPQEIFSHHIDALKNGDLDELVADYGDDSVLITAQGVARGKAQVRAAFSKLFAAESADAFEIRNQIFEGDALLLEWALDAPTARVEGNDTFIFADDLIRVQTISRSVQPRR